MLSHLVRNFSWKSLRVTNEIPVLAEIITRPKGGIDVVLERRKIYAVGLDVYKNEPNLNPGYLKHKSAFILPHLGSATKDTRTAMANLAIDNLHEFFRTGNCSNKVN